MDELYIWIYMESGDTCLKTVINKFKSKQTFKKHGVMLI